MKNNSIFKLSLISLLLLLVIFIHCILKNLRDYIVINDMGVETTIVLKACFFLPLLIISWLLYQRYLKIASRFFAFAILISGFAAYFVMHYLLLYPNHRHFGATISPENLLRLYMGSHLWYYLFIMCKNWVVSLFYIISELWSVWVFGFVTMELLYSILGAKAFRANEFKFAVLSQCTFLATSYLIYCMTQNSSGEFLIQNCMYFLFSGLFILFIVCIWLHVMERNNPLAYLDVPELSGLNPVIELNSRVLKASSHSFTMPESSLRMRDHSFMRDHRNRIMQLIETFKRSLLYEKLQKKYQVIAGDRAILLLVIILIVYGVLFDIAELMWQGVILINYRGPMEYIGLTSKAYCTAAVLALVVLFFIKFFPFKRWMNKLAIIAMMILMVMNIVFCTTIITEDFFKSFDGFLANNKVIFLGTVQVVLLYGMYPFFQFVRESAYFEIVKQFKIGSVFEFFCFNFGKIFSLIIVAIIFVSMPFYSFLSVVPNFLIISSVFCFLWMASMIFIGQGVNNDNDMRRRAKLSSRSRDDGEI